MAMATGTVVATANEYFFFFFSFYFCTSSRIFFFFLFLNFFNYFKFLALVDSENWGRSCNCRRRELACYPRVHGASYVLTSRCGLTRSSRARWLEAWSLFPILHWDPAQNLPTASRCCAANGGAKNWPKAIYPCDEPLIMGWGNHYIILYE